MSDIVASLTMLGLYMVTVIAGLLVHILVIVPVIFAVVTRRNPYGFIAGMRSAVITAFGTSSR
jgi:Na+/H+-dicarboxylate symporter